MTDDCEQSDTIGYEVYKKLARYSNGMVYNIRKNGIEKVLLALRMSMRENYATSRLQTIKAGKSDTSLYVDSTMTDIDIRLSGEDPKLTIRNPLNEIVTGDVLSMSYLMIVNIRNPMVGRWTVESESSSGYTVQMGSNSELKIKYGFSSGAPNSYEETSVQPLKGTKTMLSFFISDPSKIGFLSNATLSLQNDIADTSSRTRREINPETETNLVLTKKSDHIYITELFDAPEGKFKVQLKGVDSNGNQVGRLVSTAIESVEPSKLL